MSVKSGEIGRCRKNCELGSVSVTRREKYGEAMSQPLGSGFHRRRRRLGNISASAPTRTAIDHRRNGDRVPRGEIACRKRQRRRRQPGQCRSKHCNQSEIDHLITKLFISYWYPSTLIFARIEEKYPTEDLENQYHLDLLHIFVQVRVLWAKKIRFFRLSEEAGRI